MPLPLQPHATVTTREIKTADAVTVTTTGNAGAATGTANSTPLWGGLLWVHLKYHANAPATTVVALSDAYGAIVTFVASKTNKRWYPRVPTCNETGAAIAGSNEVPVLCGAVTVTVTASDALAGAVVVTICYVTP